MTSLMPDSLVSALRWNLLILVCFLAQTTRHSNANDPRGAEAASLDPATVSSGSSSQSELMRTLELFQLDETVWAFLHDGTEFSQEEMEPVHRLLHVLGRLDSWQRHQWSQPLSDWNAVETTSTESRGRMFQVYGSAVGWQQLPVPPETTRRYGQPFVYRIEIVSTIDERRLFVFSKNLPPSWPAEQPSSTLPPLPVRCDAIFLKTGVQFGGKTSLYLASDHLAWYPDAPLPTPWNVSSDLALLGAHRFDATLLNTLSARPQLTHEDSECFYRMLSAARRIALEQPKEPSAWPALPLESALTKPVDLRARFFRVAGTARRAVRIAIEDPQEQQRLGIRHYYEVECLVTTPRELVDRASGIAYGSFPVTLCFPELPDSIPQGDQIRVDVEATGIFLKLWSFQNDYLTSNRSSGQSTGRTRDEASRQESVVRQMAPLLIGVQIRPVTPPAANRNTWPSWALLGILALAIASAACFRFLNRPGDRRYRQWRDGSTPTGPWQNVVPQPQAESKENRSKGQ